MTDMQWLPVLPGQPVVALDFDGVLNVIRGRREPPPGFVTHMVDIDPETWPDHPYISPLPWLFGRRVRHQITVNQAHGDMVHGWQQAGAVVFWATTWERAILPHAHLAGMPELPVLEISRVRPGHFPQRTADWKFDGLSVACRGHRLVWIDDMAGGYRGRTDFGIPPAPLLVVAPDESVGLTDHDNDRILKFLAA